MTTRTDVQGQFDDVMIGGEQAEELAQHIESKVRNAEAASAYRKAADAIKSALPQGEAHALRGGRDGLDHHGEPVPRRGHRDPGRLTRTAEDRGTGVGRPAWELLRRGNP